MGRPRCDPFDAAAIIAAIGKGETTPLRAYQDYASMAARPYARASFETVLQRHQRLAPSREPGPAVPPAPHAIDAAADGESDAFWGTRGLRSSRASSRRRPTTPASPSKAARSLSMKANAASDTTRARGCPRPSSWPAGAVS